MVPSSWQHLGPITLASDSIYRIKEPPPGIPPRRGQNDEEGAHAQGAPRPRRLNGKLRMSATIVALMARKVVYGMTSVAPVDPCAGSTRPQSLASASGLR